VEGVVGVAEADHLAIDARVARLRVLQRLQHQGARSLAGHEPVAGAVEGARGVLDVVVAR